MSFSSEVFKQSEEGIEGEDAEEGDEVEGREDVRDENRVAEIGEETDGNNRDDFREDAPFFRPGGFSGGSFFKVGRTFEVLESDILGQFRVFSIDINRFGLGGSKVVEGSVFVFEVDIFEGVVGNGDFFGFLGFLLGFFLSFDGSFVEVGINDGFFGGDFGRLGDGLIRQKVHSEIFVGFRGVVFWLFARARFFLERVVQSFDAIFRGRAFLRSENFLLFRSFVFRRFG